jgi:hypothetical protein
MNPPFGEASLESRQHLYRVTPDSTQDLFAAFVSRGNELLEPRGGVGAITNRLGLVKDTLADWRERQFFGRHGCLRAVADLGYGILDAVVETAAYITEKCESMPTKNATCTFFYLLDTHQKELVLQKLLNSQNCESKRIFRHLLESFAHLPSKRIAYWCSNGWLTRFSTLPSAHSLGLVSKKGIETGKDFVMLRLAWEVPQSELIPFERWTPQSKGGPYRPVHCDIHLCFDWAKREALRRMSNAELYGHPGLTYTERTTSNFAARILPSGALFSTRGPIIARLGDSSPWGLLGFVNSSVVAFYLELFVGGGDASAPGTAARVFASTYLELLPAPRELDLLLSKISPLAQRAHDLTARFKHGEETSLLFCCIESDGTTIESAVARRFASYEAAVLEAIDCWTRIDKEVANAYEISEVEMADLKSYLGRPLPVTAQALSEQIAEIEHFLASAGIASDDDDDDLAISRSATKLCYRVDSLYESGAVKYEISPSALAAIRQSRLLLPSMLASVEASSIISYALGIAFGRWDIRYATGERPSPDLPDPFEPLPRCPLGILQGNDGLPLSPEAGRQLRAKGHYPLDVAWDGTLVDDMTHPLDLERRVHAALAALWGNRLDPLKQEACTLLGVPTLREWFRRSIGFFADHLKRYSKSRRQAPIYWQLSAGNGSYSAWLYYHRFTQDTLYRVLRDFVEPRIQQAEREQFELESQGAFSGDAAVRLQEAQTLLQDLRILKSELDLVAPLWNPDLNDGVIINHAILWRITPYTPWQKKCKECWDKLVKGDYDWAHLAFHLWPERVISKCTTDRSLAIAHGLEERLWQETNNGNWLPRQLSEADLQTLIAEHSNPAVKSALERFLAAPPPVAPTRTRASRSTRSTGSSAPRRPRGTAAVVDAEATRQVLLALTAAPSDGLAKAAIADLIGVEANALTAVIKQLKDSGQIDQLGERRGARYVLSEQGRVVVASETEVDA